MDIKEGDLIEVISGPRTGAIGDVTKIEAGHICVTFTDPWTSESFKVWFEPKEVRKWTAPTFRKGERVRFKSCIPGVPAKDWTGKYGRIEALPGERGMSPMCSREGSSTAYFWWPWLLEKVEEEECTYLKRGDVVRVMAGLYKDRMAQVMDSNPEIVTVAVYNPNGSPSNTCSLPRNEVELYQGQKFYPGDRVKFLYEVPGGEYLGWRDCIGVVLEASDDPRGSVCCVCPEKEANKSYSFRPFMLEKVEDFKVGDRVLFLDDPCGIGVDWKGKVGIIVEYDGDHDAPCYKVRLEDEPEGDAWWFLKRKLSLLGRGAPKDTLNVGDRVEFLADPIDGVFCTGKTGEVMRIASPGSILCKVDGSVAIWWFSPKELRKL